MQARSNHIDSPVKSSCKIGHVTQSDCKTRNQCRGKI